MAEQQQQQQQPQLFTQDAPNTQFGTQPGGKGPINSTQQASIDDQIAQLQQMKAQQAQASAQQQQQQQQQPQNSANQTEFLLHQQNQLQQQLVQQQLFAIQQQQAAFNVQQASQNKPQVWTQPAPGGFGSPVQFTQHEQLEAYQRNQAGNMTPAQLETMQQLANVQKQLEYLKNENTEFKQQLSGNKRPASDESTGAADLLENQFEQPSAKASKVTDSSSATDVDSKIGSAVEKAMEKFLASKYR